MRLSRVAAFVFGTGLFALLTVSAQEKPKLVLKGHSEAIYSTAFNKDGTILATGSFDKTVRLWDAATGKQLREFGGTAGHQSLVLSVAFSPLGDQIASGGSDNLARVWDVPISTPLRDLVNTAGVTGIALSADAKMIAGSASDGSIKLWSAVDGKPIATLAGHPGGATGVAFSANNVMVATCGVDGTIRLWNAVDGKSLGLIGAHAGGIVSLAIAPGSNAIYSVGVDGLVKTWLLPLVPSKPLPVHADAITTLAISADGSFALTGADKSLKLSNVATGQIVRELPGATGPITSAAFSPNGTMAAVGCADGKVHLWTVADGKLVASVPAHGGSVTGVSLNAAGTGFVTVGTDGELRSWALPIVASKAIAQPDRVLGASLSPDVKRLIVAGADKMVRTINFPAGTPERQFAGHTGAVTAAAITPDNTTIVSTGVDETIRLWNAANGQATAALAGHAGPIPTLAIAPNGTFAVSGGEDGFVKVWALPIVAPKAYAHPDAVTAFAPSPDGNRVMTVCADKQARVWNLANPAPERAYALGQPITAIAYAADNVTVALATADKSLSIRNADKEVKKLPLPAEARSVAFTPNGAAIVAGLTDNSIRVFNIADGKELKNIAGHAGAVTYLSFGPKGDVLISAGADKTVRFWNAADWTAKGKLDLAVVPTSASISKDGLRLAVGGDKSIAVFTLADNKPAGTIVAPAVVQGVALSADGLRVAAACADNRVRVYGPDLALQEVFLHEGSTAGVAFHADAKRLVSISTDKTLRLWSPALVAQAKTGGAVRQVSITGGSDRIIAVGDDKILRILDAKTAKELKAIPTPGPLVGASFLVDVSKIATAGDKFANIWNAADGKAITSIPLPGPAQAVALSPSGAKLAVAFTEGAANRVQVFDSVTSRVLQTLPDPAGPVRSLTFLADSRTLIVAGDDKAVTIQDTPAIAAAPTHAGGARGVILNPAGPTALTFGGDKNVKLWDAATWKEQKSIASPDPIAALAVSRDFAAIGVAAGKNARVIQLADGKELAAIAHPADVISIGFSGDRTRLITGSADNLARVWDIATKQLVQAYAHAGPVRGVAFHPNQPLVVTASADKTGGVHAIALTRIGPAFTKPVRAMTLMPNGSHLLIAGDDPVVRLVNAANGLEERKFEGALAPVQAIAVAKTLQVIAVGGAEKLVRLFNFADGKELGAIPATAPIRGLSFNLDAKLLVGVADDNSVTAWNVAFTAGMPMPEEFGRVVQQFAHAGPAVAVTIADKGEVFTASADKTIKQWKVASPIPTKNFQHPNLVDAVAWSPDGKQLATACHDGIVRLHDVEKATVLKAINAHIAPAPSPIYSVLWTTDGKQVLSTSFDKSMKLWDAMSGNLVKEFKPFAEKGNEKGHTDQVFCAAISKDGKLIASGSSDRKIKLWDASAGTVIREFPHPGIKGEPNQSHPGGIYQLRFTPDEKYLISVGPAPRNQGYVAVWTVADGKLVSGSDAGYGPTFGLSLSPDGKSILLGCGPKQRQVPEAEAIMLPVPAK